jgi:hypothetical protein
MCTNRIFRAQLLLRPLSHNRHAEFGERCLEWRWKLVDEALNELKPFAEVLDIGRQRKWLLLWLNLGVLPAACLGLIALRRARA